MRVTNRFFLLPLLTLVYANNNANRIRRRRLKQSRSCVLQQLARDFHDMSTVAKWQCELQGSDAVESGHTFVDLEGVDESVLADVRSGDFALFVEGGEITVDGTLKVPSGAHVTISKAGRRGPAETYIAKNHVGEEQQGRRELNLMRSKAVMQRRVLAIRIQANDSVTTSSAAVISDKIFGTNGDTNNLRERYATCSYGELTMVPFVGQTTTGVSITNGVYDVAINMNVNGVDDGIVREEVSRVLAQKLGDLPSQFDHVMLCMPPKTLGRWIGYAFVGGWMSVFNNEWCNYPSIQVHEVGHNLRLQHAGENMEGMYEDQVGLMGVNYPEDTTDMCFNLASSWELGWYGRRRKSLDFTKDAAFKGHLIGIVDYENPAAAGDKLVTVRAVSSTVKYEVYVGFNLAGGFNRGTGDGINQVTVTVHEDEGESNLLAELNAGGSYRISNFQGTNGLNIRVHSINLNTMPPFAEVEVYIDNCPAGSTNPSCNACASNSDCARGNSCVAGTCNAGTCSFDTARCPGNFELSLRADAWGGETTWQLINTCTGIVAVQGGPYARDAQISVSQFVGHEPHKLALYDSRGDGFEAPGHLIAMMDGLEVARESGNFKYNEFFYFGTGPCGGVPTPTIPAPVPAPAPIPAPVPAPIASPVIASVVAPIGWNPIFSESFESGRSSIFTRGRLSRITRTRASDGRFSIEIRDNRGVDSAITTIPITLAGYQQLQMSFRYFASLADQGESFFLEFSPDSTNNFRTIRVFTMGADFQNNQWMIASLTWDITGTTTGSIRIRSGFSDSMERITIDQITLHGQ